MRVTLTGKCNQFQSEAVSFPYWEQTTYDHSGWNNGGEEAQLGVAGVENPKSKVETRNSQHILTLSRGGAL